MASEAPGQEGLQYLCSKYSSLITKLREEVLARQTAEGAARLYEGRLREEASLRDAERHQWEEERHSLRNEVLALRARQQEMEDARNAEALQVRQSIATSRQLSARCDHLHEACAEEAQRKEQVISQATAGGQVLIRQGEELTTLRREYADCLAQSRATSEELETCREHLSRWRHTAADLEGRLEQATGAGQEAESKARHLQEEMRQALRSASAAKAREAATAHCAGRGQRELQSRQARLTVMRKEGQRFAQRASSAERRLRVAESYEVAAERLSTENRELRLRLDAESRLLESARLDIARAEAGEARSSAGAGEFQSELRAKEALAASARQRVAEVEGELSHTRARLEQLELERTSSNVTMEGLRTDLKVSREEREESCRQRDKAKSELVESRRRIDRGTPQLAECRRRLQQAEESVSKAGSEAAEERRARERCHAEAMRASEKLRAARQQSSQLRERVRQLEEVELRYPSRISRHMEVDTLAAAGKVGLGGGGGGGEAAWGAAGPLEAALPLTPSPPRSPRCFSYPSGCVRHDSPPQGTGVNSHGEIDVLRDFVAREEQRFFDALDKGTGGGKSGMLEEPRAALPTQSEAPALQRGLRTSAAAAAAASATDSDLAALLAAEPRVLKLPEPLRLTHAERLAAHAEGGG